MSRCKECDIGLISFESQKIGLCRECRDPDLYDDSDLLDALESATDLEEKLDILLNQED